MEEQLVSFKTAKLAKEKGFQEPVYFHYYLEKDKTPILQPNSFLVREMDAAMDPDEGKNGIEVFANSERILYNSNVFFKDNFIEYSFTFIAVPNQSLLQKWIREEYNIDIIVLPNILGYEAVIYNKYPPKKLQLKSIFKTCEEALEIILYKALELIKI